jgi:hypothetical protein
LRKLAPSAGFASRVGKIEAGKENLLKVVFPGFFYVLSLAALAERTGAAL